MSRFIKGLFFVAAMVATLQMSAFNLESSVEVSKVNDALVNLTVTDVHQKVTIVITDEEGELMYSETSREGNYSKNYNFENLEEGNYTITFKGDLETRHTSFSILDNQVIIGDSKVVYSPSIIKNNNVVSINKLMNTPSDSFKIKVYHQDGTVMYKTTLTGELSVGQMIDISNLEAGTYSVVSKHNGETFYNTFTK